jgi:inorganic pyrophosphatase
VKSYKDVPQIVRDQIEHFFAHYKDLEKGKWVKILGWIDAEEAAQKINEGVARLKEKEAA